MSGSTTVLTNIMYKFSTRYFIPPFNKLPHFQQWPPEGIHIDIMNFQQL